LPSLGKYIAVRILSIPITLFLVTLIVFGLMRLVPGDPATIILGQDATEATLQEVRRRLGLDAPLHMQYINWIVGIFQGNLGRSIRANEDVALLLAQTLPNTLMLTAAGFLWAIALGIPMGIISSVKRFSKIDYFISAISAAGMALPNFWLGIVLLLVFGLYLGWFPVSGYVNIFADPIEGIRSITMPAFTLGTGMLAYVTRMLRTEMLDVLRKDYIVMARSKGLKESKVIYWHALRNALISTVTVVGLQLGYAIGGVVIVEEIFLWPGMGRLIFNAVKDRDYIILQSTILVTALLFLIINLIVDILYAFLNPRIRYAYQGGR
jgi:peptide/nickel transport system permease protein